MATGERTDPYRNFNFRVEIDGLTLASFSEVSGLSSDGDAIDYREGTDLPNTNRRLMGLRKYTNITLRHGRTQNVELWNWYANIMNGIPDRRHGAIILMDEAHNDVLTWLFENAWINKIEGPTLKATGNEVAIESVELVHESLTIEVG